MADDYPAKGIMPAQTVSVPIARPPDAVYDFIVAPENLPSWAAGLARGVRRSEDGWILETPDGPMGLRFADRNPFRVADHWVTMPDGVEVLNQMRVLANGNGSEVIFTVIQIPGATAEQFAADCALVEADLQALKRLLEGQDRA